MNKDAKIYIADLMVLVGSNSRTLYRKGHNKLD
jgi:hypothetical protein